MSAEETSGDEQEVNEIARNKKWVSNSSSYNQKCTNFNNNLNSNYRISNSDTRIQTNKTVDTEAKGFQNYINPGIRPLRTCTIQQ